MNNILILVLSIFAFQANAQVKTYFIEGKIQNIYQGQIFLVANSLDSSYYLGTNTLDSSNIENGVFKFKRNIIKNEPLAYRLLIKNELATYSTGLLLLSSQDQKIEIDSIDEYISPNIGRSIHQKELRNEYYPFFKSVIDETRNLYNTEDSVSEVYGNKIPEEIIQRLRLEHKILRQKSDSLFWVYAINHRNSYVTLWKLIERFDNFGYTNQYYDIMKKLSPPIKYSLIAKEFSKKLELAKLLAINTKFPKLELKNLSGKKIYFNVKELKAKYILVDFWFLRCGPCLREFPSYKKILDKYNKKDFNIIGISIDKEIDLGKINTLFLEKKLNWTSLLDENGVNANKLGIYVFPTNFLLDQNGIIIRKNISLIELDLFLKNTIENQNIYIYDNVEPDTP